jgi:hypothetical protein
MPPLTFNRIREILPASMRRSPAPPVPAAAEPRQYKILQSSRAPAQLTLSLRRS